jgi:endonuclease/exonuclease/phosphatase family metal-dependent hydrolase
MRMKLDAIYTRGFHTRAFSVTAAEFVSDHYAIWADVRLVAPQSMVVHH